MPVGHPRAAVLSATSPKHNLVVIPFAVAVGHGCRGRRPRHHGIPIWHIGWLPQDRIATSLGKLKGPQEACHPDPSFVLACSHSSLNAAVAVGHGTTNFDLAHRLCAKRPHRHLAGQVEGSPRNIPHGPKLCVGLRLSVIHEHRLKSGNSDEGDQFRSIMLFARRQQSHSGLGPGGFV